MALAVSAVPLSYADAPTRTAYLRRVSALTLLGLSIASMSGLVSAGAIAVSPGLHGRGVSFALIMGTYLLAQFVAQPMVFSRTAPIRWAGFFGGSVLQGVAMGYLLLAAVMVSAQSTGSPFLLIAEALGLTGLAACGMTAWLWTGPRELSYVKGALSALFLPMMVLSIAMFVFPSLVGGPIGVLLAGAFVVISTFGLLYQINVVLHQLRSDMHVEGAYMITMGVLVLFWNILSLLMRLQRR